MLRNSLRLSQRIQRPSRSRSSRSTMSRASSAAPNPYADKTGTNAALGIEFAPSSGGVDSWSGGVLAVGVYESDVEADDEGNFAKLKGSASDVDQQLGGILSELAEAADFKGKTGSSSFARTGFSNAAQRVGVVGLGKSDDLAQSENMKPLKQLGGALADDAKASKKSTAAVYVPSYPRDVDVKKAAAAIAQGTMLAAFNETRYKQSAKPTPLTRVDIIKENSDFSNEIKEARSHAEGIMLTKELVNGPAEHVTPTTLEETFKQVASKSPNTMHLTVLGRKECEQRKMEPFLAVGRGSAKEPKFIHLQYTPQGGVSQDAERIALVGKGITYDAGGINIKPSQGGLLEVMKFDMGGAGAVAGAASIIADSQPKDVVVDFIVPACENMVDADSFRPGDILTASNGKTIEITNTDAEGRLVLSEGMLYANELGATKVVDIATLTGAMLISLGSHLAGYFTNSDELSKRISEASKQGEDRVWQMPLEESYWQLMESKIADCVNAGPREAGSILAALFLQQFAPEKGEWGHLDIAGACWDWRSGKLATGFGASLLSNLVLDYSK